VGRGGRVGWEGGLGGVIGWRVCGVVAFLVVVLIERDCVEGVLDIFC